jgi:hypothetical protein
MTNEANTPPTDDAATAEGRKGPRRVRLRDEVIADLREDIAKLTEKLAKLQAEAAAEEQLKSLKSGDAVSFVYGRDKTLRIESGTILAIGDNGKGSIQINVLVGEGITSTTRLIGSSRVVPPGVTADEFLATFAKSDDSSEEAAQ